MMNRRNFLKKGTAVAGFVGSRKLLPLAAPKAPSAQRAAGDLFFDDFSSFAPGWLSHPIGQLNAAIQEYHYLAHRGVPLGPWANAICQLDAWVVGDEDGKPYLDQQ